MIVKQPDKFPNKEVLLKFGEADGNPTYGGNAIGGGANPLPNQDILIRFGDSGGQPTYNGAIIAGGSIPSSIVRQTFNLFDKSRMITGSYHDPSTGNIISGGYETHKINVKPGYNYIFNKCDGIATQHSFYTASDVYISGASAKSAKAPANASYLHVKILSPAVANVLMVMETNYMISDYVPYTQKFLTTQEVQGWYRSKWYEKTWWVLGDSISTGYGDGVGAGNQYAAKPYHYLLSRERHIKVQNDAVSGYTIGNIYDNRVVNMPPTQYAPDLITLMAGTNDHGFNIAMGSISDDPATGTSFYARYQKTIEWLINRYPYASIGLIVPIQRSGIVDGNTANAAGKTLRDYCDAVVAIGKYYSIPVLDWYYGLGFSPYVASQKENYYFGSPSDGTHPNDAGHVKMAATVGDFIERL
ncbi:SGNH/GDSL hydrolase family protein [Paenibacillus eucommiae]|uniref:Lysophospholipase L1-like esterase n=1 Tax=Paenibacillus eucommiae TaxID=1355755 RepID=A0ABS4J7Z0_9BACL|nr:SGNH/GDSL hydrolase family protein [Paenibacillus eucommiae]MBP1995958.1 lysophospholipase L1-like esterase [Paenibacillus eucommiae]